MKTASRCPRRSSTQCSRIASACCGRSTPRCKRGSAFSRVRIDRADGGGRTLFACVAVDGARTLAQRARHDAHPFRRPAARTFYAPQRPIDQLPLHLLRPRRIPKRCASVSRFRDRFSRSLTRGRRAHTSTFRSPKLRTSDVRAQIQRDSYHATKVELLFKGVRCPCGRIRACTTVPRSNSADITRPPNREPSSSSQWSEFLGAGQICAGRKASHELRLTSPRKFATVQNDSSVAALAPANDEEKRMKKSRFTEAQIGYALRQAEAGTPVGDVCRQLGVSEATFCVWKKKFANLGVTESRKLRMLEASERRLRPCQSVAGHGHLRRRRSRAWHFACARRRLGRLGFVASDALRICFALGLTRNSCEAIPAFAAGEMLVPAIASPSQNTTCGAVRPLRVPLRTQLAERS